MTDLVDREPLDKIVHARVFASTFDGLRTLAVQQDRDLGNLMRLILTRVVSDADLMQTILTRVNEATTYPVKVTRTPRTPSRPR
jgi:hypothetical protein